MNSLYIGLGGAGIASVATYAKMAQGKDLNRNDEFLYLDTDEYMVRQFPVMGNNDFVLLGGNQMSLDRLIQRERYDLSGSDESRKKQARHFFSWFDENAPDNWSRFPLNMGSGANRMAARAMLFYDYNNVKNRIANKLTYVDENGNQQIREVFVVYGTCGGTGSGIVLDILYMIQEIFHVQARHNFVNLLLIMPEGYIHELGLRDVRYSKYCLNSYALFEEINACLKDYYGFQGDDVNYAGMQWYKHRCCDDGTPPVRFHVFSKAFLFESVDPMARQPFSYKQIADKVSDFIYSFELSSSAHHVIANHFRAEKINSRNKPFIKGFAATGMYVVQTWEELTRKYVKEKFIYQMLYHGFIGSGEQLEPNVLGKDICVFDAEIDRLIADYQHQMHKIFTEKLEGVSKDELYHIVATLERQLIHKDTRVFEDVFERDGKGMDMELKRLLMQVKDLTNSLCVEWAKRYNLNHALQIIEHLDRMCEMRWNNVVSSLNDAISELQSQLLSPLRKLVLSRASRNEKVAALFADLVQCVVYRNLSEHGYLDDCRERLREAIGSIDLNSFEMTYGVSVGTWEHHYIKHLMAIYYDSTKSVWPNLDMLLDREHACLYEDNPVERDYASLVLQDGKNPDLRFDLGNDRLLYSYKTRCVGELDGDDERWSNCFMDFMKGDVRDSIRIAFEAYAQKVKQKAEELANAPELSKSFATVFSLLSPNEQSALVDKLSSFDSISLSTHCPVAQRPSMSLYSADFHNIPNLQGALAQNQPPMNTHFVQNTYQPDRVVKLNVEFGYSPDDYRYYDCYKGEFDRHLQTPERDWHHQPFIDKRFAKERKLGETLADMFERKSEEE